MQKAYMDLNALPALHFGTELRLLRERAGWTQRQLGELLHYSDALVGFVETATRPPTQRFADACDVVFATRGHLGRLSQLVRRFGAVNAPLDELLGAATSLRISDPLLVPAFAQTDDYARAVLQAHHVPADAIDPLLDARPRLTTLLAASPDLRVWAIVDETTLYRPIGSPGILRRQLEDLLMLIDSGRVIVQVLRTAGAAAALLRVPQVLMGFADGADLAHLPNAVPDDRVERYGDAEAHGHAYDLLRAAALPPGRSRGLLAIASR
jgi:transcriptional regulator with XRE-family HTH domain